MDAGPAIGELTNRQRDLTERHLPFWKDGVELAPDHHPDQLRPAHPARVTGRHGLAVPQDGDAVGDRRNLLEPMRDVNDPGTPLAQPRDDIEQARHLPRAQRRGRLVHDDDARVRAERLGNLHHLLLGHRQPADEPIRIQRRADSVEQCGGMLPAGAVVYTAPRATTIERQGDVFGDREMRKKCRLLVDRRDPQLARGMRRDVGDGNAIHAQRSAVGPLRTGEDFDERRLARAIFADQRVDLAGSELERNAFERA